MAARLRSVRRCGVAVESMTRFYWFASLSSAPAARYLASKPDISRRLMPVPADFSPDNHDAYKGLPLPASRKTDIRGCIYRRPKIATNCLIRRRFSSESGGLLNKLSASLHLPVSNRLLKSK
jgi:hypothetical protein